MAMLDSLFGQVKGVLGKAFLLTGLLPSAIVLGGWHWFRGGAEYFRSLTLSLASSPAKPGAGLEAVDQSRAGTIADAILLCCWLFILGLVFFACRGVIQSGVQQLPWSVLRPLREFLTARKLRRLSKAERKKEQLDWQAAAINWHAHEPAYDLLRERPDWINSPQQAVALRASRQARETLNDLATKKQDPAGPSGRRRRRIVRGLCMLRAFSADLAGAVPLPSEFLDEITAWSQTISNPKCDAILNRLFEDNYRRWLRARQKRRSFPAEPRWVQPTELGNRVASLDDYAARRYLIPTGTLWTRIIGILTKEERREVDDAQLAVEALTNIVVASAVLAISVLSLMVWDGIKGLRPGQASLNWWAAFFVVVSALVSAASYKGSSYAFAALSEKVTRLVDLHTLELLRALGFKTPPTVGAEINLLNRLADFFSDGCPLDAALELDLPAKNEAKPESTAAPASQTTKGEHESSEQESEDMGSEKEQDEGENDEDQEQ